MPSGVKKIAQVAVGAVIGFVQGGPVGAAIGAGLAFYAASQQEKLNTKSPLRDNEPSAQTVRSSKAPIRFILGRVSTGGVLVWAQEQSGTLTEGEQIHLVYVLCEGAIDGLENIYLGEEEIGSFGEFASYELIVNPTEVNSFLKANCQDWKDSQIGRGLSFVRITLKYSAEKFPSGIPDTRFVVRGRNDIYDPRTGNNIYTANTALHILWYLRTRCNVPDDEIIFETFASAANVCDEALTNADGSVSQRYRTSCVIGADEQRPGVLQKLEASCAGKLLRVGGRWMLQAGAYYGPYDFEITEDMIIGTVSGSTESTNDSAINTVRGTFIDPEQSWTETDYPEVSVSEWILEDGGEAAETMTFSYVTDAYQPQRLANIAMRQRRAGGAISLPMNFSGYNCRPGRVVRVNLPSLNILGEFIVSDWSMGDNEGCTVQVKQYEAAIFDDAVGQPYNPLGFITLPSGGLGSPTGLAWAAGDAAEVVQGVLSWVPPQGIVTSYVVTVRQGSGVAQSRSVPATANTLAINGLPSGAYTMSVAALGPMARSGEATISVSIQGPPIPESCVVQSSIDSIVLIPQNPNHGLNGGTYEYFFSTNPNATSGTAQYLGQGLSFTHNDLAFYTNYYYFIRSSNAYGKSAFLYVPASTSNDVSAYLAALAGKISKTELNQELQSDIELISGDGAGSVNERLEELKAEIGEITDALVYVPTDAYVRDNTVRVGDNLWTAIDPVPAKADGSNGPPNPLYWVNTGQSIRSANAQAAQVSKNTADISTVNGKTTATAAQLQAVQAQYRSDSGEGDLLDALKGWDSTASVAQEVKVRAEQDFALAQRATLLDARVGGNEAKISIVETAQATDREATAQQITNLTATVTANQTTVQAAIQSEATTRSNADGALATQISTAQATANGATAQAQTASTAVSGLNGKVSALTTIKTSTTVGGRTVMAGLALGVEGQQQESQILAFAQRFAILDESSGTLIVPFVVQGGKVIMDSAVIGDGTITNAKIGNAIQSNNYVPGVSGWKLFFDGTFEINSSLGDGGRQTINGQGGKVFDQNRLRYQWGNLAV
ncbi:phage tail tip fiber protein [Pseudomonas fragariae (ex Marin et al. 2024)]|uniref:phage tail tip fiber protein n=1 Tax=Pseudomonas fragariae (ex Marin et al. 2024) TaxID=3080056 RepID=UPI003F79FAFB